MLQLARKNALSFVAALLAAAVVLCGLVTPRAAIRAVDFELLFVLFALLVAVELLRESGVLDLAVARSVTRFRSTRSFTAALILFTGGLAALVTNDVTLFIVIPFTAVAGRFSEFDIENAVILEVMASNLIGCLTPLGNPQNLFAFHRSGWSAGHFMMTMLPFVLMSACGLFAALFVLEPSRRMETAPASLPPLDLRIAIAGAICFALVLLEIARITSAVPAAITAVIAAIAFLRHRLFAIDLSIVPLFFCAFIIVEGLRSMNVYRFAGHPYFAAIALSQVISNVPATVLLSPLAVRNWKALLYGANAGGCGTIIASLANLLGWRIYGKESGRDKRFFWRLTVISFLFLAWVGAGGWLLL